MARIGSRRGVLTVFAAVALGFSAPACGDDDDDDAADPAAAIATACDRLEDLAEAVLANQDAESPQAVVESIDAEVDAFVEATARSGDDELASHATDYRAAIDEYASASGIDAREAANEADIALDRAGLRCSELGATNVFPTAP